MSSTKRAINEGSIPEPRYPAEDATQGLFSFGASGFLVNNNFRESGKSLKRLLFPELLKSDKARTSARDDASTIDNSWTKAQLQHYGISFNPELDSFKAKALLLTCVAHGLCDVVPPQVARIKATLKEEYKSIMTNYHDNMKAYRAQKLPQRTQNFEACATPSEEVKCDPSLFLRKYFLDKYGNAHPTKTPDLILLPGYNPGSLALMSRLERVPALHMAKGGRGGANNVTVIGWDRERVKNKAFDIDMQQTNGRGVLRSSDDWDSQMTIHLDLVEERRNRAKPSDPNAATSFDINYVGGRYFMECGYVQHEWPVFAKQLSLRFISGGRLAIFDLGIIVGLMVLGKTQAAVSKVVQDGTWNAHLLGVEEMEDDDDSEDVSSDEEDSYDEREPGCSDDSDHNMRDEPNNFVDLTSDRPAKRQKSENDHPRRLYFQWRGYNTVTGVIKFDARNLNTGHLDFAQSDATTFEGRIRMDAGLTVGFNGYKIPGLAGPLTMNWNALSHLASERAKVPEHIW